ncbi:MAG: HAD family hydrolase [Dorea sp.]
MIKTILFDLDGTLLPMDQDVFVKAYMSRLAKKLIPLGYDKDLFLKGMWNGVGSMIKNDGTRKNEERFWKTFCEIMGEDVLEDSPVFEEFYRNEFQEAKEFCGFNPKAAEVIHKLQAEGYQLILATNPLFPSIATESRIRWAGLTPEDFSLFTTYEHCSYCKPNPKYYLEILEKMQLNPEECLMVGNDVNEDMIAAEAVGIKGFLLTDCLINKDNVDISTYPHGDFDKLMGYLG